MTDSNYLFESESLPSLPQELIKTLPSQRSDYLLNNDYESILSLEHNTDLYYQLTRLKAAKIYFSEIESVYRICKLLNAHGDSFDAKIELLREMHQSLAFKRQVLAALEAVNASDSSHKKSVHKAVASHVSFVVTTLLRIILYSLRFLYPAINRPVKVHFGSGVVTFFIYCWWFFCINMVNLILTLFFLAIPQHVFNELYETKTARLSFSLFYIVNGTGWFANSTFYYAGYTNKTFEISRGIFYNMPLVYILVISGIFFINFFIIIYSFMTYCAKQELFSGDKKYPFSKVVFSHYDYATGFQAIIDFMKSSFYEEVQSLINQKQNPFPLFFSLKLQQTIPFLLVNLSVFFLTVGSCTLIFIVLYINDSKEYYPLVVSLMLNVMPNVFYYLLKYIESYDSYLSPKTIFYVSIVRLLILRIVLTGLVLYFWIDVFKHEPCTCHQNQLSGSFFRIVLGNFCVQLFFYSFIAEYLRRKLVDTFGFSFGKSDFDLAYHSVDILYSQFLGLVGLLYVPLIPLLIGVHLYLLLFLKANSILENCHPSKVVWTSGETDNFLMKLTLMCFVLSLIFFSYSMLKMGDSACGPFSNKTMKNALLQRVLVWKPNERPYQSFTDYGWSPIVLVIVTMLLGYIVIRMRSYAQSVISLKDQLENELKSNVLDNSFLLHRLDKVLKERDEEQVEEERNTP